MDISTLVPPDPIVVATPGGRTATLKWLSAAGISKLDRLLKTTIAPRDFLAAVLHSHLISPAISVSELTGWPQEELDVVGKAWAAHPLGFDRELQGDDVPVSFREVASEYVRESTLEITRTLNGLFETIRRQNETMQHLLGPTAAISAALNAFSATERMWQQTMFSGLVDVFKRQQNMIASLGSVRLLDEITRAARVTLSTPLLNDLSGVAAALQAATVSRSILTGPLRLPVAHTQVASMLDRGIASLTSSAEQVWRTWASEGGELAAIPESLRQAPALEVYSASSVAASVVGGQDEPPPQLVASRAQALIQSLPGALARVHSELPRLLDAATALMESSAPESSRHFAVSLRELLTHLLHRLAPDDAISNWGERKDTDYHDGRPTRPARVRFILRVVANSAYAPFMADDIKRAVELLDALNKATHALESASDPLARRLILRRVHFIIGVLLDGHNAAL